MTTFTGQAGVTTFVAITLKHALRLYAKTGMKANRAYTPRNMLAKATEITGRKFKRGEYEGAAEALEEWLQENGRAA